MIMQKIIVGASLSFFQQVIRVSTPKFSNELIKKLRVTAPPRSTSPPKSSTQKLKHIQVPLPISFQSIQHNYN